MDSLQVATDAGIVGTVAGILLMILAVALLAAWISVPFLLRNISRRLDGIHSELRAQNNPKTHPGRQILGAPNGELRAQKNPKTSPGRQVLGVPSEPS